MWHKDVKTTTAQKMKFFTKDFFSKCDQLCSLLKKSHLLKKSLMENFIFCAVNHEVFRIITATYLENMIEVKKEFNTISPTN